MLLLWPPFRLKEAGLAAGFRLVSNVKTSFGSPPWLILTTWTLLYVAWAAWAESAKPSHATPTARSSRVALEARMDIWNIEKPPVPDGPHRRTITPTYPGHPCPVNGQYTR